MPRDARLRAARKGPEALAEYRRKVALKKRRARARAAGVTLNALGDRHPSDCPCFDCLFPVQNVPPPRVYCVRGLRRA